MVNASPRNCDRFSQGSWWRSYGVRLLVSPSRECEFQRKRERGLSLNPQAQAILSAKYFNGSTNKVQIFSVIVK